MCALIKKGSPKQFGKGRTCKKHGCKKQLNIYNAQLYCHVHSDNKG